MWLELSIPLLLKIFLYVSCRIRPDVANRMVDLIIKKVFEFKHVKKHLSRQDSGSSICCKGP